MIKSVFIPIQLGPEMTDIMEVPLGFGKVFFIGDEGHRRSNIEKCRNSRAPMRIC